MTIAEITAIVEPFPDDMKVTWGCIDHTIPKKIYACHKSTIGVLKEFLAECDPLEKTMTEWKGQQVIVRSWLMSKKENEITFYIGLEDHD